MKLSKLIEDCPLTSYDHHYGIDSIATHSVLPSRELLELADAEPDIDVAFNGGGDLCLWRGLQCIWHPTKLERDALRLEGIQAPVLQYASIECRDYWYLQGAIKQLRG